MSALQRRDTHILPNRQFKVYNPVLLFLLFHKNKNPTPRIIAMEKIKLVIKALVSLVVNGCPPLLSINIPIDKIVPAKTEITMIVTRLLLLIIPANLSFIQPINCIRVNPYYQNDLILQSFRHHAAFLNPALQ